MASSEAPRSGSRRFFWLAVFIVILFGGYSLGWFWLAGKATDRVDATIARLSGDGRTASCDNRTIAGYPFRIGVKCDSVSYLDEKNRVAITAGAFRSAAQAYEPMKTIAELDGPLRIETPFMTPLFIEWDLMHASARLAKPFPSLVSIEAKGLSGISDPDDETDPVPFFSAEEAQAHFRPNGPDLDWAGSFKQLEIDPGAVGNRILPVFDGEGDATIKNGIALAKERQTSMRGQAIDIRNLALVSGDARLTLTGTLSVDTNGLIDAALNLAMQNPAAVGRLAQAATPERASEIGQGFAALSLLGDNPSVPLIVEKSRVKLNLIFGSVTLGQLPPLD